MTTSGTLAVTILSVSLGVNAIASQTRGQSEAEQSITGKVVEDTVLALIQEHGNASEDRIKAGVNRVAAIWWAEDGSAEEFAIFCRRHFIADEQRWAEALRKTDRNLEVLKVHLYRIDRDLRSPFQLNRRSPESEDQLFVDAIGEKKPVRVKTEKLEC